MVSSTVIDRKTCKQCGSDNLLAEETPDTPHHAKEMCGDCGAYQRWLPKPDSEKARRPAAHRDLVRKYSEGYCELCLIAEDNLPAEQTLEGHHIIEHQDGGGEGRENIQIVCTKCHKLIHWNRNHATPRAV